MYGGVPLHDGHYAILFRYLSIDSAGPAHHICCNHRNLAISATNWSSKPFRITDTCQLTEFARQKLPQVEATRSGIHRNDASLPLRMPLIPDERAGRKVKNLDAPALAKLGVAQILGGRSRTETIRCEA